MNSNLPGSVFVLIVWACAALLLWECGVLLIAWARSLKWDRLTAHVDHLERFGNTRNDRSLRGHKLEVVDFYYMKCKFRYLRDGQWLTGDRCNIAEYGFFRQNYDEVQYQLLAEAQRLGSSVSIWSARSREGEAVVFRQVPSKLVWSLIFGVTIALLIVIAGAEGWLDTEMAGHPPMLDIGLAIGGIAVGTTLAWGMGSFKGR